MRSLLDPRHKCERGQALVLAILVMLVMVIGATSIAGLVTSNQTASGRERAGAQALSAGEGGLDLAANLVYANWVNGTSPPTTHYTTNVDQHDYAVEYWVAARPSGSYYLNATATSPDGRVKKVLQEQIQPKLYNQFTTTAVSNPYYSTSTWYDTSTGTITTSTTPPSHWGYGFVMGGSPHTGNLTPDQVCANPTASLPTTEFGGSGEITVPTWIMGDVCISGGAEPAIGNPAGSTIPVHIGGSLYVDGPNSAVGTPTNNVATADIGTCFANFHAWFNLACNSNTKDANDGGSGVYAASWGSLGNAVTPPTFPDDTSYWSAALAGSNTCGAGSTGTYPAQLFDTNAGSTSGPDTSLGTKNLVTLLGTTAFDCKTAEGELVWTPSASPKTLKVTGTVFFDANLTMAGNDYIKLAPGSDGSIYIDGYLKLTNDGSICAYFTGTTCTPGADGWSPGGTGSHATDPKVFFGVFNRSNQQYGFDLEGNSNVEGIVQTNLGFYLSNSAEFSGSIFANYAVVNGAGTFLVTGSIPAGANQATQTQTTTTVSTTTNYSTSTAYTTSTGVSTSQWASSWNIVPGSWKQCPTDGCP